MDFKLEHLLLFVVAAFLLYHLMGGCANGVVDGFSVGGQVKVVPTFRNCVENACRERTELSTNQIFISKQLSGLDNKLSGKVDTLTDRLDELICQLVQSEKCITDQGVSDCK